MFRPAARDSEKSQPDHSSNWLRRSQRNPGVDKSRQPRMEMLNPDGNVVYRAEANSH
jgi:hypothetical protein